MKSSDNRPIIMNRNVTTTLQHFLDLVFRDLVEYGLSDLTVKGVDSTSSLKYALYRTSRFVCGCSSQGLFLIRSAGMTSGTLRTNSTARSATWIRSSLSPRMSSPKSQSTWKRSGSAKETSRALPRLLPSTIMPRQPIPALLHDSLLLDGGWQNDCRRIPRFIRSSLISCLLCCLQGESRKSGANNTVLLSEKPSKRKGFAEETGRCDDSKSFPSILRRLLSATSCVERTSDHSRFTKVQSRQIFANRP